MRSTNTNSVAALVIDKPMSIPAIVQTTGLSYSTVKRALDTLSAQQVEGTWPIEWKIGTTGKLPKTMPEVGPELAGRVAVGVKKIDNLVSMWNERRQQLGMAWAALEIKPTDDPKKLAEGFATAASTLANLANTIQSVATKPDWFTLAGGELEQDKVS